MKRLVFFSLVFFALVSITSDVIYASDTGTSISDNTVTIISEEESSEHPFPDGFAFMVIPFAVLLFMIATGPLFYHHFWENHYPKIAIFLGSITVLYYLIYLNDTHSLVHTLAEYLSFIALLASLFVASSGILIRVDKKSTPMLNVVLFLFGAVIANIIGTTGASMLLIRPFIRINKDRIKAYHIIFFIFLVSNIGGALTPIGDPPLFLGFLRGVDFFWFIQNVWHIWLITIIILLAVFYIWDSRNIETDDDREYSGKIEVKGLKNIFYLIIILLSVFIDPGVMSWVPSLAPLPFGIREIIMFSVVYISYNRADKEILRVNEFNFEPIKEVAYLFIGIFATMMPALQLIAYEAGVLGEKLDAGIFYWGTGLLSGFLDNAPTYLNFLSASMGKFGLDINVSQQVNEFQLNHALYLQAISVAAVFFGAMTYIGNGPNFMVKSICERAGISMPSFFAYWIKYAIPVLIPIFTIIWLIFYFGRG